MERQVRARKWTNVIIDDKSSGKDLKPGDLYVAQRNTMIGFILLTCKKVDFDKGWVEPEEMEYLFDLHECRKVIRIID